MSAFFSAKTQEYLLGPLSKNNPVIVQVLGICSALAVTAKPVSYTHLFCYQNLCQNDKLQKTILLFTDRIS